MSNSMGKKEKKKKKTILRISNRRFVFVTVTQQNMNIVARFFTGQENLIGRIKQFQAEF